MLNEGWRAKERGRDVVVGYVETHGRQATADQIRDLEVVPRRSILHRGQEFEEMDVDAIIARKPERALIDELAHTNVPGSRNEKRWQDVEEIRGAGINVISTLNIQHLESVNDVVEKITGIKQRETIPDAFVRQADQVQIVDETPEALRRRMAHGNIYPAEKIDAALTNYFRTGNLSALRELALLWVADNVEEGLQRYMDAHGITASWETRERVLVAVRGTEEDEVLIRRGARMASRSKGDLVVVHVRAGEGLRGAPLVQLDHDRELTTELGGSFHEVAGSDVAQALTDFARGQKATQLVIGSSQSPWWRHVVRGSVIAKTLKAAGAVDVHVISSSTAESAEAVRLPRPRLEFVFPPRRIAAGAIVGIGGSLLLTLVLSAVRSHMNLPSAVLLYLLLVIGAATVGGLWPALGSSIAGSLLLNYYFTPPIHTFTIAESNNLLALIVFVVVAVVVSALVTVAVRRQNEATHGRAEAEILARIAATLVGTTNPEDELMRHLITTFGLEAVALMHRASSGWHIDAHAGTPVPTRPQDGDASVEVGDNSRLVLVGAPLRPEDQRVIGAFAAQLAAAITSRRLASRASAADQLAAANELRSALLAAVSHDLRTPLASIKASVTSLLGDISWSHEDANEFLRTIDTETDRLNKLVGNLLDMSRLQTGGLNLSVREVGLEEVVATALTALGDRGRSVDVDVPETLPRASADPTLLERAVANLVDNALTYADCETPVRVVAGRAGKRVELRVVDRGPGIPEAERERAFLPFRRLGDADTGSRVGLGLAVARGFVEAMGGELVLEDTPGGGLTAVVSLEAAA
jgi:two-component system sensor histidine kinase KdpD